MTPHDSEEPWFLNTAYLFEYLLDSLGGLEPAERDRVYREIQADPELAATWLLAESAPQRPEFDYAAYARMRDTLLSMRERIVGRMLTADELVEVLRAKRVSGVSGGA